MYRSGNPRRRNLGKQSVTQKSGLGKIGKSHCRKYHVPRVETVFSFSSPSYYESTPSGLTQDRPTSIYSTHDTSSSGKRLGKEDTTARTSVLLPSLCGAEQRRYKSIDNRLVPIKQTVDFAFLQNGIGPEDCLGYCRRNVGLHTHL